MNLYAYASNNPTSYRDIDGHEAGPISGLNIGTVDPTTIEAVKYVGNEFKAAADHLVQAALHVSNTEVGIAAFEALNTAKVEVNFGPSAKIQAFGLEGGAEAGVKVTADTGLKPGVAAGYAASADLKVAGIVNAGVGGEAGLSTKNGVYAQVKATGARSAGNGKVTTELTSRIDTAHHGEISTTVTSKAKFKLPLGAGSVGVSADTGKVAALGGAIVHSSKILTGIAQAGKGFSEFTTSNPNHAGSDGFASENKRW